jgi:uncharacterized protein YndB with AHSA1/START domain
MSPVRQKELNPLGQQIKKAIDVKASAKDVWQAWTTEEGCRRFFAPRGNIELTIGGKYEPLFDLDAPAGSQGGEGLRILAFVPEEMMAFTWNAPPQFKEIRAKYLTWVVVRISPGKGKTCRVSLNHLGWGDGGDWPKVFAYFDKAWDLVLWRLARSFEDGPIDWDSPYRPPEGWTASTKE